MLSRQSLRITSLLLLFMTLHLCAVAGRADEDDYDDYEVTARVLRLSLLSGEVSLLRAGSREWEAAQLNAPLVEGDTLATGRDSRLEIQIDARNFLRLGEDSVLRIVTLREEGIALSLSEGKASLRLVNFDRDREYFEIDAPKTTLAAEKRGLYRLDVSREGRVRVTVRDGGRARIYSESSGFTLRENRTAELVPDVAGGDADWELSSASSLDEWDRWNDERERHLAALLRYEHRDRYYDREVWGAEELDSYGEWSYASAYGWVWCPSRSVISQYPDWAPYRYGSWSWVPPYGWTWVADEPWGWAPYHYGRWVYYNDRWCWAPRGYGYPYKRPWWRPALVAFVYVPSSYGEQVCWYPLTHKQRDPHSRNYGRERLRPMRADELRNLQRTNPAYLRAVSTLPARDFGAAHLRARPATPDIAQRAIAGEPVRGRLPIAATNAGRSVESGEGRMRSGAVRPGGYVPARVLAERPTGATARTPGVEMDSELRRSRIYNNREPRITSPAANSSRDTLPNRERLDPNDTGAVLRPARPAHQPVERRPDGNDNSSTVSRPVRPAPVRPTPRDERDNDDAQTRLPAERRNPGKLTPPDLPAGNDSERRDRPDARDNADNSRPETETHRSRPSRQAEERPADSMPRVYDRREKDRSSAQDDAHDSPPSRHRQESPSSRPERAAPPPREERRSTKEERLERSSPREERHQQEKQESPRQEVPRSEPQPERSEPKSEPRHEDSSPRERSEPDRPSNPGKLGREREPRRR